MFTLIYWTKLIDFSQIEQISILWPLPRSETISLWVFFVGESLLNCRNVIKNRISDFGQFSMEVVMFLPPIFVGVWYIVDVIKRLMSGSLLQLDLIPGMNIDAIVSELGVAFTFFRGHTSHSRTYWTMRRIMTLRDADRAKVFVRSLIHNGRRWTLE